MNMAVNDYGNEWIWQWMTKVMNEYDNEVMN